MRADATRNLGLVLRTGARLLADDPSASIAAAAGVDRRTVYRRFASPEELLAAAYRARLDAVEDAVDADRLQEASRLRCTATSGGIAVNRRWPAEPSRMIAEEAIANVANA